MESLTFGLLIDTMIDLALFMLYFSLLDIFKHNNLHNSQKNA